MTHYERNRKAVQKGLDHRKALRLEAQQDAAQLEFINGVNAHSKTVQAEREARRRARTLQAEEQRMEVLQRKVTERKDGKYTRDFHSFLNNVYPPLVIAAACMFLGNTGIVPSWIALTGVTTAGICGSYMFITTYPTIIANMLKEAKELTASSALENK